MQNKYRLRAEGCDFEKLLERVSEIVGITPQKVVNKQRDRKTTQARDILCYWATDRLGMTQSQLAEIFNLTQSAISHAVKRGMTLVEKGGFVLMED